MDFNLENQTLIIPLQTDETGKIRVVGTRLLLETIINAYNEGESPEGIVDSFSVLDLPSVYAIIAYYLTHRAEVNAYLKWVEERSEQTRQKIQATRLETDKSWRQTLRARLEARTQSQT